MVLSQQDIISYRNLLFVWFCPKTTLSYTEIYCLYDLVPRRYYIVQKTIDTNSFHGLVQEDIIAYKNSLFVWSCPKKI